MAAPYPVLFDIVEAARIRLNDAIIPGGEVLTDSASFTAPYINLAWQKYQQFLVGLGYVTLEDETIVASLAPAVPLDPAIQVSLSWTGYNNGTTTDTGKVLPQSLIRPMKLWERPSANPNSNSYNDMDEILQGLPSIPKGLSINMWEWRADAIYMPGSTVTTDIRLRFAKYLADFVPNGTTPFTAQVVPIMRSEDAFAGFIAYEMSGSRGDVDSATLLANAKEAAQITVGFDSQAGRATQKTSERGKMKDRYTGGAEQ